MSGTDFSHISILQEMCKKCKSNDKAIHRSI